MTMTINSGSTSYCSAAQFVQIFDYRTFAQLASDTDTPLASSAALQASAITAAMLQIAAGDIEMAATVGARYDPDDLAALAATSSPTNGGWAIIQMNAALAAAQFFKRRFESVPEAIAKVVEEAEAKLSALEQGIAIFPFADTQQAGIITDYKETAQDVQNRNLPSYVARRVFGVRGNIRAPNQ